MKTVWAILCERAIIDRDTNNVSLINIVEELTVTSEPPDGVPEQDGGLGLALGNLELVVLWSRTDLDVPEHGFSRIRIASPEGKEGFTQENEVDLTHYLRLRSRIRIPGLPMEGAGVYLFRVDFKEDSSSEWSQQFELPLRVVVQNMDAG